MAFKLNNEEVGLLRMYLNVCESVLPALRKEADGEFVSSAYIKEKADVLAFSADLIKRIAEKALNEEVDK